MIQSLEIVANMIKDSKNSVHYIKNGDVQILKEMLGDNYQVCKDYSGTIIVERING